MADKDPKLPNSKWGRFSKVASLWVLLFLIPLIVILMVMVVVSLVRGIVAFMQSTKLDLESDGDRATQMQLKQNKMMFARIKYQALAIVAVIVLMMIAG